LVVKIFEIRVNVQIGRLGLAEQTEHSQSKNDESSAEGERGGVVGVALDLVEAVASTRAATINKAVGASFEGDVGGVNLVVGTIFADELSVDGGEEGVNIDVGLSEGVDVDSEAIAVEDSSRSEVSVGLEFRVGVGDGELTSGLDGSISSGNSVDNTEGVVGVLKGVARELQDETPGLRDEVLILEGGDANLSGSLNGEGQGDGVASLEGSTHKGLGGKRSSIGSANSEVVGHGPKEIANFVNSNIHTVGVDFNNSVREGSNVVDRGISVEAKAGGSQHSGIEVRVDSDGTVGGLGSGVDFNVDSGTFRIGLSMNGVGNDTVRGGSGGHHTDRQASLVEVGLNKSLAIDRHLGVRVEGHLHSHRCAQQAKHQ